MLESNILAVILDIICSILNITLVLKIITFTNKIYLVFADRDDYGYQRHK